MARSLVLPVDERFQGRGVSDGVNYNLDCVTLGFVVGQIIDSKMFKSLPSRSSYAVKIVIKVGHLPRSSKKGSPIS
ncbi:unnamed protein product [Prunus armeniaca]